MCNRASKSNRACTILILLGLAGGTLEAWGYQQKTKNDNRPQVPWGVSKLSPVEIGAYDSKAEPAAEVLQALNVMTLKGWGVIRQYYPKLSVTSDTGSVSVSPHDPGDTRFYAAFANEDPGRSPIPLISMICSLEPGNVTGNLKSLRAELLEAIQVEDYSGWSEERLRQGVLQRTMELTTSKGVKYRGAKKALTFKESAQLYGMIVALLEKDTKWTKWQEQATKIGYTVPTPPDMHDFANRLKHQMPMIIPPGATRAFLLYRPGWDIGQPISKTEYEERADVVLVRSKGTTFEVEQFPVYFTNDQKIWNPDWIGPQDELKDTTLLGRKFEQQWTRFDGPYLWYKKDQLNGEVTYRSTVKFEKDDISITSERFVTRRGGVVRTWRDPEYEPENMKRVSGAVEMAADPFVVEPPELDFHSMWRVASRNIHETCYTQGDRELFWYSAGEKSWSSSVFPRPDEVAVLRPMQPVTAASSGIVARFNGDGALRPSDVELLRQDQMTSVRVAVGLMNRCLENAAGESVSELRVSLPREKDNQTPIYFYSSAKTTAVQKSPSALIVTLPEGYYNSYESVFNRLLWVLERPFASDAEKVTAINQATSNYLREKYPPEGKDTADPVLLAWSQVLHGGTVEGLFSASILPSATKPAVAAVAPAGEWLRLTTVANVPELSEDQKKASEIAVGLTNLYLASAGGDAANAWRRWYPGGTRVAFRVATGSERGEATEELRQITSSEGEKHNEAQVTLDLPPRAYPDNLTTLIWMLGVLEVNARARDRSGTAGGQGTGLADVLQYLRHLDGAKDIATNLTLARLGLSYTTLAAWIPDVPPMFLSTQQSENALESDHHGSGDASVVQVASTTSASQRPIIQIQFPKEIGEGPLGPAEQKVLTENVRIFNLYLTKKEEKKDAGAEHFRRALPPAMELYLYRNSVTSIHRKAGAAGELMVGLPVQDVSSSALFIELLRVLEMQDERLTQSPGKREQIAASLKHFLETYAKDNAQDETAAELSKIDVKTMTEL